MPRFWLLRCIPRAPFTAAGPCGFKDRPVGADVTLGSGAVRWTVRRLGRSSFSGVWSRSGSCFVPVILPNLRIGTGSIRCLLARCKARLPDFDLHRAVCVRVAHLVFPFVNLFGQVTGVDLSSRLLAADIDLINFLLQSFARRVSQDETHVLVHVVVSVSWVPMLAQPLQDLLQSLLY